MSPFLRPLCLSLLFLVFPLAAHSQPKADDTFDARVAKPTFTLRRPKLVFDLAHHNTHTSVLRYDALATLATNDGYDVFQNNVPFAAKNLKGVSILLIANPLGDEDQHSKSVGNAAFTQAECEVVYRYVEAGGSLLLVCDHAPMAQAGRILAERFGVNFGSGYLIDPALADTAFGASTLVFSRATGTLGEHPTLRGRGDAERITRIRTYTGQSLSGPAGSVPLLKVSDKAQDLMLGPDGVKGVVPEDLKRSAGGRSQGLAFTLGKGRVVVLGESTMLAAQLLPDGRGGVRKAGMNAQGFQNRQFAMNVLHWLSGALK